MTKTSKQGSLDVLGTSVVVLSDGQEDYISLTDMVSNIENGGSLIYSWMRNRNVIEFLGIWELIHNPDFKGIEFDTFKTQAGLNNFTMTPRKWIDGTGAIGIKSFPGRYNGGTFAHRDIAFEFGSWLSPEFKLYLIKDFQRLKEEESRRESLDWSLHRTLSKVNYKIHTDAVKEFIVPELNSEQAKYAYANEADVLNVALFGQTAKQWRDTHKGQDGNIRETADIHQLLVLANIESMNAEYIKMGLPQHERLAKLNAMARSQIKTLRATDAAGQIRAVTSQPRLTQGD